jgi:MFS family permease
VPDAEYETDQQEGAEVAVVAAAPAHLQEAAAELAPVAAGELRRSGLRHRVAHNFAWLTAAVAAVFAVAAGAGMVLSGTDVGIVAALETGGHQAEIGLVFVFWCAASVVGGLLYGAMHRPVSPIVLLLGMAALTIPMGFARDTLTLCLLSLLPGLLCAPVLSSASEKVAELVEEGRRGEAMGWYGSALTAGVALGAPLAGVFIDGIGPSAGFVSVGAAGVVLCLFGLVLLRHRRRRTLAA